MDKYYLHNAPHSQDDNKGFSSDSPPLLLFVSAGVAGLSGLGLNVEVRRWRVEL